MELSPKTTETYAGRKLVEQLEYAASSLEPSEGFKLELHGVKAIPVMQKELEAYFGASLDAKIGADIVLGYNTLSNEMVLEELSFAIKGIEGRAKLFRTHTLGYIPVIEIRSEQFDSKTVAMDYEQGPVLLAGLGIENFDSTKGTSYKDWRDSIIAQTSAWQITERLDIPLAFHGDFVESVSLMRSETMDLSHYKMSHTSKMTKSIILFNEDETTDHTEMSVQSIKDLDEHALPIAIQSYRKTPDIFSSGGYKVSRVHTQMLPLDESSFHDLNNTLEEIAYIRSNT